MLDAFRYQPDAFRYQPDEFSKNNKPLKGVAACVFGSMGLSVDGGVASPKSVAKLLQDSWRNSTDESCADFALLNEALFSAISIND